MSKPRRKRAAVPLPLLRFPRLFHVGFLAGRGAQSPQSLEGPCLSVSVHPAAWTRIARLGGSPCWSLSRRDGQPFRMLDMLSIPAGARRKALGEAVSRGLLLPVVLYRAWSFDDESGEQDGWRYSLHATRKEAEAEVCDPAEGPDGKAVEPMPGYEALPELSKWWFSGVKNAKGQHLSHHLCEDAAILYLARESGACDGAWWEENLDPGALSAPRGALFPEAVAASRKHRCLRDEMPDEESGE